MHLKKLIRYVLPMLLLCIYQSTLQGQSALIRAEQQRLPLIKGSINKTNSLNRLGTLYLSKDIDSSFYCASKAKSIAIRFHNQKGQTDADNIIAKVLSIRGLHKESLELYSSVLSDYRRQMDSAKLAPVMVDMAFVYTGLGESTKAWSLARQAIQIGGKLRKDSTMSYVYAYYPLLTGLSADSTDYYLNKSRDIAIRYKDEKMQIVYLQRQAAKLLDDKKRRPELLHLVNESLAASRKAGLTANEIISLNYYAYYYRNNPVKVLKIHHQIYKLIQEKGSHVQDSYYLKIILHFTELSGNKAEIIRIHSLIEKALTMENENIKKFIGNYVKFNSMQENNIQLELTNKKDETKIWLLICVCGTGVLLIIIIYRLYQVSRRHELEQIQLNLQIEDQNKQINEQNLGLFFTLDTLRGIQEDNMHMIKTVAHDLRSPMAATVSIVSLLLENKNLGSEDSEMLEFMKETNLQSLEMTANLLNMNASFENMEMETVAIDTLLNYCVKMMAFKAAEKNQKIVLQTIEVNIQANREKLWMLFGNLITNAIKFSPLDSTINVEIEKKEHSIRVRVADNGIGISREMQVKIFDLFTRSKRDGTSDEQSFGLGLTISKQIVETHRGKIWFESESGIGTTFYTELPI
jgi:signal transduction histidine kinase